MGFSPILGGGFNPLAAREDEDWIIVGSKHKHPEMSFREHAFAMKEKDLIYLPPPHLVTEY